MKPDIRDPILRITGHANERHDLSLACRPGGSSQDAGRLEVAVGGQSWQIRRPSQESVQAAEEVRKAKRAGKEEKEENAGKAGKTRKARKTDEAAGPARD
ncbi:hypothetical protein [Burkholderia perseverans]|uniref:hypothetical protein n=1 Tax=Burkholderia perseverans TaxID=2615214 RepID=UPI001FEF2EF1|nr:hypothetical protein [Burkholderia perseverans]